MIDSYGRLLEIARAALKIKLNLEQNLLALEMLYNLFTVYTNQLRENPNSFYTLVRIIYLLSTNYFPSVTTCSNVHLRLTYFYVI